MTCLFRWLAATCLLLLTACAATGPRYADVQASFPVLRSGEGRIVFYRENSGMGAALTPDVRIAGQVVGALKPGSFFFVDRAAGRYTASAATEAQSNVDVAVRAGDTTYVRMTIGMGLFAGHPELTQRGAVDAMQALASLAYIGGTPLTTGRPPVVGGGPAQSAPPPAPAPARPDGPADAARSRAQNGVSLDDLRGLLPAQP